MNKQYLLSASALLVLVAAGGIVAQRPAGQPAPTPTTPPATASVSLPTSKMAVIDTNAFLDPKAGITKFNAALTKLNAEFTAPKNELTGLQQRAQTLQDELTKLQQAASNPNTPIDTNTVRQKSDQLEQLKKDIQRKGEDAQANYNRRREEIFAPLQEEVGRALEAFAKARGINVIIDAAQVPLLYADINIDITRAFIADFNSKNPATAAATPPK